jgi:hypothetical protein
MKSNYLLVLMVLVSYRLRAESWWSSYDLKKLAVVAVPVADMLVRPALNYDPRQALDVYKHIPFSCDVSGFPCVRTHQCLYNEVIFNTLFENDECKGILPDAQYGFDHKRQPYNTYYTRARNVLTLWELAQKGIHLDSIPRPYALTHKKKSRKTLTLILPWRDVVSKLVYSAGTCFVRCPRFDTETEYAVFLVDYTAFKVITSAIAKNRCIIDEPRALGDSVNLFLNILHTWTDLKGEIPYVLGGSSFVGLCPPGFSLVATPHGKEPQIYIRHCGGEVKSGFDCSELIWRVAHMAGLPYFYKNTAMLADVLKPLRKNETIRNGDLIWMPGHVAIVSDVDKNEVIEATGYESGYGKVLKLKLFKRFEGISSYNDLVSAYHSHKALVRIEKTGARKHFSEFKIFKLLTGRQRSLAYRTH